MSDNLTKDRLVKGPFGSDACYEQTFKQEGKEVNVDKRIIRKYNLS